MKNDSVVRKYTSSGGTTVYKLPVEAFPNHVTNCYLIMADPIILLDTASGWESANQALSENFLKLKEEFGESVTLKDVGLVIVTHGHIDHFGGVNFVLDQCDAELAIHDLDVSVIRHHKERLLVSSKNLRLYLSGSGLSEGRVNALLEMNKWSKDVFQAREVDFTFHEGPVPKTPLRSYHVPGHCPGQVCLQLDDLLFTADHVLSNITPNQSPESITRYTGVGHYMESLRKIRGLEGVRVGLGGHEFEMEDLQGRADDTLRFHDGRLNKTLDLLKEPMTVAQVSQGLFGKQVDYNILLALTETGAHVEYLYERGQIIATNIEEVEMELNPVLTYQQR